MHLEELYQYKNQLMKDLCTDPEIVRLVTGNKDADCPSHTLPYTQLFPFEFVPETENDSRTFICFDVDVARTFNKVYYQPVLYIWIFTHKSKMRTEDGKILIDELSAVIDKKLNGNRYYGLGELNLDSAQRFVPIADYLGRVLVYEATDFNRSPGVRPMPANRRKGV